MEVGLLDLADDMPLYWCYKQVLMNDVLSMGSLDCLF